MTLTFDRVEFSTGGRQLFAPPLNVTVPAGQVTAVTGPSGAGKTVLLSLAAGDLAPTAGVIDGRPEHEAIAWIPQNDDLARDLTALENVALPIIGLGAKGRDAERAALDALAQVGLEESGNHLVEELSGGQQQRVAIARALASPATFIVADEPTSALDAGNRRRVLHLLHDRAAAGSAVLLATNDSETLDGVQSVVDLAALE